KEDGVGARLQLAPGTRGQVAVEDVAEVARAIGDLAEKLFEASGPGQGVRSSGAGTLRGKGPLEERGDWSGDDVERGRAGRRAHPDVGGALAVDESALGDRLFHRHLAR